MATHPDLDPVASTGRLTAALRAVETTRDDRLFTDPFAAYLAGEEGRGLLDVFGDNSTIAVRTRFYDDALLGAAGRMRQIVIVAAGMDTRAYRLDLPADTTVFELDRPEVLDLKDRLLAAVPDGPPRPRCRRHPVGVDLATDWSDPLRGKGFRADEPTCWLVEGLLQYLTEAAVAGLLDRISAVSAAGSELHIDVVGQSLLDSPAMAPLLDRFAAHHAPWLFGTDSPEDLLSSRGWHPEVTLISSVGTRLGRWPYPEVPRGTPGVGQGYFALGTR
ncbi:MAG TPA: SAM-dependent methyltransferase [Pseudonocardiaceae bacterium]|nr:SAM-dependent methyltransferase [Pseudonocardiaceae bacterium]